MLEILSWKTLIKLDDEIRQVSSMFKNQIVCLNIQEKNWIELCNRGVKSESEICTVNSFNVQKILQTLARKKFSSVAESRLSKLVVSCLSALESEFSDLSFDQKSKVDTKMNFIFFLKVVLTQISVWDETVDQWVRWK